MLTFIIMLSNDSTKLIYSLFEILNLSSDHAETYISLLNKGRSTTTTLAKHCDIPRTTFYSLLDELLLWQLVEKVDHRNKTFYQCTDPYSLIDLMDHHKNRCDALLYELKRQYSDFELTFNKNKDKPETEQLDPEEIKDDKIAKLLIGAKEIRVIINTKDPELLFLLDSILDLSENPGLLIRELILRSTHEYIKERSYSSSKKIRVPLYDNNQIPNNTSSGKIIADDIVISITKELVTIVKEIDIINTEIQLFDTLWKQLTQ